MANKEIEYVSRVLPVILAEGDVAAMFPLTSSLPGEVAQFDEPELVVLEATARALDGEISIYIVLEQTTYYLNEDTGLVKKAVAVHRMTKLLPVPAAKAGGNVLVAVEAGMQGAWQREPFLLRGSGATLLKGDCKLQLHYTAFADQEIHFVKLAGLDGETLAETVEVEVLHGHFGKVVDLQLPLESAATAATIGELSGVFRNGKAVPMCGWVKVEGEIFAEVPCLTEAGQSLVESYVFPLRYYVEEPESRVGMGADVCGRVELLACVRAPDDGKVMLRGLLTLEGRLTMMEALELAVPARSSQSFVHTNTPSHSQKVFPKKPGHQKHHQHGQHPILLEEVVAVGSSQTLIQREIFFPRRVRKVREPVAAEVRNLQHEIIPNKVIVRGILHKQIFAVDAETGVVFAQDVDESFVHFVDVPGASPRMRAHVRARVEFVQVEINPGGETARQVTIVEIVVKVTQFIKKELLPPYPAPHPSPIMPVPGKPAQTVYIVRSGDTVWKIANMFGVSMQAIIDANNLVNPNLIFPGQQLIIPK